MQLTDLLDTTPRANYIELLSECSDFLQLAQGTPLFKALPSTYNDIHRVKVRVKRSDDVVSRVFNEAFSDQAINFRQRVIPAYNQPTITEDTEPFYVFPINGFKYMYSLEVKNSTSDYSRVLNTLFEQFGNEDKAAGIITDVLKYTYKSSDLLEGINQGAEILLYNIPYFFAVRCSSVDSYQQIFRSAPCL